MNHILTITEHEQIIVGKERDLSESKKVISYEDRELLFDIEFIDKNNKKRYIFKQCGKNRIKADSIVGSISLKNGLIIEILPKFARDNLTKESIIKYRKTLLNMIKVSNERNFIVSQSQNSKISMGEMPLINYVIELFSNSLLNTLRNGLFLSYSNNIDNSSKVKGNILISRTIQNNFVDKSKVYTSYNKHSSNNLLMQIFRTLSIMLLKDNNLSYSTKQNLYEIYMLLNDASIIYLRNEDFEKIVFNRLNDHYELLLNQAKFIFNKYMPFSSQINSTPFWSILFDMDYLFEKFISYLFKKSNIDFLAQDTTDCYFNDKFTVTAKPDFVIKSNESICVADAKWKLLDEYKTLYGLNAQNFWQLYSYMDLLFENNQLNGYFIVPKNNDNFKDEILFSSSLNKNKPITIISIDFTLDFNEIKDNFYFEIMNNELKYCRRKNELIICKECNKAKNKDEFVYIEIKSNKEIGTCKKCSSISKEKTPNGIGNRIFNKLKKNAEAQNIILEYTQDEFKNWLFNQDVFTRLYDEYFIDMDNSDLKPSCYLIETMKYNFENIFIATSKEVNEKNQIEYITKEVVQFDKNNLPIKIFQSVKEAKLEIGLIGDSIYNCCTGKANTAGGFKWKYIEDVENEVVEKIKKQNIQSKDANEENFDFEEFINELEILHKDKQLLKKFLKNIVQQKELYKNIFYLKNIQKVNTSTFKQFIKDNLDRRTLEIDSLNLKCIPSNINKLKSLEILVLSNNKIKEISSELFTLKKLQILNLSNNSIENIPHITSQMRDLKILKLNGNNIINIDINFIELKNLEELHIDKIVYENNKNILKNLKQSYNTYIYYYDENNKKIEYLIKDLRNKNYALKISNKKEYLGLTKEEVEIYNQKDDYELIEIASDKSLREDFKIILFYKEYINYDARIKIQQILKQNSNKDINDYLFEKTITEIINLFKKDFDNIYSTHKEWIFGFLFCNNNKAVFEIKKIIAEKTNSRRILEILSDEKNERKILNEVVSNKFITIDIVNKIVEFVIEYGYDYVAHSLVKLSNIGFENIQKIINKFERSSLVKLVKETEYNENNEIQNWIYEKFPEPSINFNNYDKFDIEKKLDFVIEAKFNTYPDDLIKKFCYESNQDILIEILADKYNTLKLRFVILIYILNFKEIDFKNKEIFNAIKRYDNKQLNEIIEINENLGIESVVNYLVENFQNIEKEILLGYSMSNISSVFYIRDIICDLTLDLDVLNELSKNKNDETILKKIIFKAKNNKNFQEMVKGYNTKYSKEILTRISQYNDYFEIDNEYCLICQLAKDYYNTTIETKYYLYNNYGKERKDKTLLNILYQNLENTTKDELVQLKSLIIITLEKINNEY